MPNLFTNLKHTILLDIALEEYIATLQAVRAFAINASPLPQERGDKVRVKFVDAADAATDFEGVYLMQGAQAEGIEVSLNKHKFVSWSLTDKEISEQPQIELETFARQKGFALAKAVFQDILSQVVASTFAQTFGLKKEDNGKPIFGVDEIIDLSSVVDVLSWSELNRALIVNSAIHATLRKDPALKSALNYGGSEVIRRGDVPSVDTFDKIYKSVVLPANIPYGIAVKPDAMLVAMRYLQPQPGNLYHQAMPVSDAETGLTFGYREWYSNDTGTRNAVIEAVYGYQVGNPRALVRLTDAAKSEFKKSESARLPDDVAKPETKKA